MPVAPPALVAAPPRQALPYGLFSHLTFRPADGRWESGVQWETITCEGVDVVGSPDCYPTDGRGETPGEVPGMPKDLTANGGETGLATPLTVYGHFACSPLGYTPATAQDRATAHLLQGEEKAVEAALWSGSVDNLPFFADSPTTLDADAVSVVEGIGLMEEYIADTFGFLGMIHLPRRVALYAIKHEVVVASGGRLFTVLGTPVVAGAGYPSPVEPGSMQYTGFVTPPLMGYRSEVFASSNTPGDLLKRSTNDLYAVAERTYLLGYDPCGVGVTLLDLAAAEETS